MAEERKEIFIREVERLFAENENSIDPVALDFFKDYCKGKATNKKEITEKGISIILGMRAMEDGYVTAAAIGAEIDMNGKSVAGSLKKLVTDGYVEKKAGNPAAYRLTEKGQTCEIVAPEA